MKTTTTLLCALSLVACAAESDGEPDLSAEPGIGADVADAKEDAFGSRSLAFGETLTGTTAGDGLVLFDIDLAEGDAFRVDVTRESGDLRPSVYLYEDADTFVSPESFDVDARSVSVNFLANNALEHVLVVRAHRGRGAGDFSITATCTGGPCAGDVEPVELTLARADECLSKANTCTIQAVSAFEGELTIEDFQGLHAACLAEQGAECVDACDFNENLTLACLSMQNELGNIHRDGFTGCYAELEYCLDVCSDFNPWTYGEPEFTEMATCWIGYQGDSSSATGSCLGYIGGVEACGGGEYAGDTVDGCLALCGETEGAWTEGPWDGCEEMCDDI
ncbi:MAG: hypothetical protein AAF938_22605 [Myxococcota bacterium]